MFAVTSDMTKNSRKCTHIDKSRGKLIKCANAATKQREIPSSSEYVTLRTTYKSFNHQTQRLIYPKGNTQTDLKSDFPHVRVYVSSVH